MKISEAFNSFNAKQKNIQWSVSAINQNNELVLSLWKHFFKSKSTDTMTYTDHASRWKGPGNSEFRRLFEKANSENLVVRAIIAKSKQPNVIINGGAGSNLGNTFHPKPNWIGEITRWDGEHFEIEFRSEL